MKVKITNKVVLAKLRDRAKGALWGLIVGDCLGSPFQFGPRMDDATYRTIMDGRKVGEPFPMLPCKIFDCPPGYWTDDGSMAMCVMDSVVRNCGKLVVKDVAETFHRWYRDGYLSSKAHAFDVGGATSQAITRFAAQGTLKNGNESTQGNGAVMRFAPTFFAAYAMTDSTAKADAMMHDIGDITHNSSVVRNDITIMADIFRRHLLKGRPTDQYSDFGIGFQDLPNGGWSVSTVKAACGYFHRFDSFEESLTDAVWAGGDSDTIAAVTGQIAGSFYGYSKIPRQWVEAVKDWEKVDSLIESFLDITVGRANEFPSLDDLPDNVVVEEDFSVGNECY